MSEMKQGGTFQKTGQNQASLPTPLTCSECGKVEPSYRCPVCYNRYCSSNCCQSHKANCEGPRSSESAKEPHADRLASIRNSKEKYHYTFPSEDTIPLDKLMAIKEDQRIVSLLKSSKLRNLIKHLDETPNPKMSFKDVMKDPEFRAFSNVILEIVGIKDILDES